MIRALRGKRTLGSILVLLAAISVVIAGCVSNPSSPSQQLDLQTTAKATAPAAATAPAQTRNFTLYVRQTQITTPDGQKIWAFGYTDNPNGPAKIPGPTIAVNQGDTVNITLVNDKDPTRTSFNPDGDGHTIHLHGLDMPSAMDGDPMTAPGGHAVMQGTKFLYHFVAQYPGTYYYHCHEGAAEHIQMGMYGALIIRPRGQANVAYPGTPTFNKEYTFLLSEMDAKGHNQDYATLYQGASEYNWTDYHPNYFFINGKTWPDTMMDPNDNVNATVGQTVLIRLINTGYVWHSIHSHGFHMLVVGTDGRKLDSPYYKDTLSVGPAERYDVIIKLDQVGRYMFHDHAEQNTTNNGDYPGGMITMVNVNNPDGSNPVPMKQMMSAG